MMAPATLSRPSPRGVPADYRRTLVADARLVVHACAEAWAREAVESAGTLHTWAEGRPDRAGFPGRGTVHSIPAPAAGPEGRERWAVRHYRRGGAMASYLDDRYLRLGRPRPFRELAASAAARARGVDTPVVLAGAVYPAGLYYRCDLATEVVPGATTLTAALHETDGTRAWLDAMRAAGALVDGLGEAGVFHVDLNAHNVLFEGGDFARIRVVDLDRARILRRPSEGAKERMRARLTRSIVKVGTPTGERLGDREVLDALRGRSGP